MTKTEIFIEKAQKVHGDRYDYSKVDYINNQEKIIIICKEHGEFLQRPNDHLKGSGCPTCGRLNKSRNKMSTQDFINKSISIHGNTYDYSKVNFVNYHTKITIICPLHGEFEQLPGNHLKGKGCPSCYGNKKKTIEQFKVEANLIHKNAYDYSKSEYQNTDTPLLIICKEHGEFWQTPYKHIIRKQGCPICGGHLVSNTQEFIEKATRVHGKKFNYNKVQYINNETKVCIICKEHGEFWQTPVHHLRGEGCPKCKASKMELSLERLLKEYNINYITQYTLEWLITDKGAHQFLDFYLPDLNIGIECQGIQHFEPTNFENLSQDKLEVQFKRIQYLDKNKRNLCKEHGIEIIYYSDICYDFPYPVFTSSLQLIDKIKTYDSINS